MAANAAAPKGNLQDAPSATRTVNAQHAIVATSTETTSASRQPQHHHAKMRTTRSRVRSALTSGGTDMYHRRSVILHIRSRRNMRHWPKHFRHAPSWNAPYAILRESKKNAMTNGMINALPIQTLASMVIIKYAAEQARATSARSTMGSMESGGNPSIVSALGSKQSVGVAGNTACASYEIV